MNLDKLSTDTAIAQFGLEMPQGEPNFSAREDNNYDDDEGYDDGESGWVKKEFRRICGGTRPLDGRVRCQASHPLNAGKRNDCINEHKKRQRDYDACVESVRQQNIAGSKAENLPVEEYIPETTSSPSGTSSSGGSTRTMDSSSTEQPKSNAMIYVIVAVVLIIAIVGFIMWKRSQKK